MKPPKVIPHAELDQLLGELAADLETYDQKLAELAREFDREGTLLEISDPMDWRDPAGRSSNFVNQFELDVDSIHHLDRDEEVALARRIEFARLLVDLARERAGLEPVDEREAPESTCKLPRDVARRENELQTLRKEMVERNLYLVMINVLRYAQTSASRSDLVQEGAASLFRAVDGFDWRRGLLFRTYAVHWLNQAFRNHLYNFGRTVRVPVYLQKALKHINEAKIKIGPEATPEEIAAETDLTEKVVRTALSAANRSLSLDAGAGNDEDGNRLRDLLADEDGDPYTTKLEDVSLREGIAREMDKLGEREKRVIRLRFGIDVDREYTLSEVASELGVSVERVRQIQVRAVTKMNTPRLRKDLEPFLN